jgi:DNA-binding NarL/FixJ family response regulator
MAIVAREALRTSGPVAPAQRAGPVRRPRIDARSAPRFSVMVLARPDSAVAAAADAALRAVGALDVRYATSPADLLRAIPIPAESGVGVICRSPHELPVVQLVAQLRQRGWRRLLIVCGDQDEAAIRTAIALKVRCFIKRPDAPDQPVSTRSTSTGITPNLSDLSAREVQVLQAVAEGHTNNEIGELLGLSGLTVKSHLARIGRKAGTGDRAEMVARGMRAGLLH